MLRSIVLRMLRISRPLFVLAAALIVGSAPAVDAAPEVVTGTLRVPVVEPVRTLDPALAHHNSERLCVVNLFDQLYEYEHLARPFALRPALAAAMPEVSEDRRTYTIKLKKGVRYQDDACFEGGKGREVTAHDVVFCFKRLMDANVPATGRWLFDKRIEGLDAFVKASAKVPKKVNRSSYTTEQGYPDVAGFEAVDDHTLKIRLDRPYPALTWVLAHSYASIYPPEAVATYGADFGRKPVGSGPYRVATFRGNPANLVALVKSPTYREDRYPESGSGADREAGMLEDAGKLLPRNNRVDVVVIPDVVDQWNRFLAGQLDLCPVPTQSASAILTGDIQPLEWLANRGVTLHKEPQLKVMYTAFNMEHEVYGYKAADIAAAKAAKALKEKAEELEEEVTKEAIAEAREAAAEKALLQGRAIRRAISLVYDDGWTHHQHWSGLVEALHGPLLSGFPEYDAYFQNEWQRYPGDPLEDAIERAKKVLAEAGLEDGKGIPTLRMDVVGTGTDGSEVGFARIQKNCAKIGITIEANYLTFEKVRARITDRSSPMWMMSWQLDYPDPENLLQLFYGPGVPLPNDSGYRNPEFDKLYEEALTMPPGDDRSAIYQEMQEIVVEDCVYVWSYRMQSLWMTHDWLRSWRRNEICPKYFKYCSVDTGKQNAYRAARLKEK